MASCTHKDLVRPAGGVIALVALLIASRYSLVGLHRDEFGLAADGFL